MTELTQSIATAMRPLLRYFDRNTSMNNNKINAKFHYSKFTNNIILDKLDLLVGATPPISLFLLVYLEGG